MTRKSAAKGPTPIEAITHNVTRANIPTADAHDLVSPEVEEMVQVVYPRDLRSPMLVWKGKEVLDETDLQVDAPPLYIQEKIDPRVLIENLRKTAREGELEPELTLFETFDGLSELDLVEFYKHSANWSNRMILGDSLQVMASLAERERLRGKVQMIYIDPPYGIKFGSNWQVSARHRSVRDGNVEDVAREAEQIRAFRDTWELGIHSYLTYMRDRLIVARDLLTQSGSVFVQIGDENVHLVRSVMDEVFGAENFVALIALTKSGGGLDSVVRIPTRLDYLVWYGRGPEATKYRPLFEERSDDTEAGFTQLMLPDSSTRSMTPEERSGAVPLPPGARVFRTESLTKPGPGSRYTIEWEGKEYTSGGRWWGNPKEKIERLLAIGRVRSFGNTLRFIRFVDDFGLSRLSNLWDSIGGAPNPVYVVQTNDKIVERCILMTTDPGDLVLDPTCGSGTTAAVAERWGRRWITVDSSRVALAVARQRLMATHFPYFLLTDSAEGRARESKIVGRPLATDGTGQDVRLGFVYERRPRVTIAGIADNPDVRPGMSEEELRAAIVRHSTSEILYDRPLTDSRRVRVSGPFTVESLSPHRNRSASAETRLRGASDDSIADFVGTILENLRESGIQNGMRAERLEFELVEPHAGIHVQAVGSREAPGSDGVGRAGICIGPQYGTVGAAFVKDAAREAGRDKSLDLLCILAFAFDPQVLNSDEEYIAANESFDVAGMRSLGRVPVLLVRMNSDLLMGQQLAAKAGGNLFTTFGEPDIHIAVYGENVTVELRGVDVYDPNTGVVRSDRTDKVALWVIDTDYDGESFFVRHCYFTGGQDPYKRLKTALQADINEEAWKSLYSTVSRPFPKPSTGSIAVKVINDYGDEVVKVYKVA